MQINAKKMNTSAGANLANAGGFRVGFLDSVPRLPFPHIFFLQYRYNVDAQPNRNRQTPVTIFLYPK